MSRTAVREAVKALREKGLVEAYPGGEPSSPMEARTRCGSRWTDDALRTRRFHLACGGTGNSGAGDCGAGNDAASEEDLAAMREQVAVMDARQADPEAYIEADLDFHLALAEAAANPLILSLIDSIVGLLREQRMGIFQVDGGPERGQYHHKRILEAIEHRDPEDARDAMQAHLEAGARRFTAGAQRTRLERSGTAEVDSGRQSIGWRISDSSASG